MQGNSCRHEEASALWLPDELTAIISNPQKHDKYALITNSPKINQTEEHLKWVTCSNCGVKMEELKINLLSFGLSSEQIKKEQAALKYSILRQTQKQGELHSILGQLSFLSHKRSSILTHNLAISSQKDLGERLINSRKLYSTSSSQFQEQIEPERDMSSSIVFSIHKQDQMEKYTIYVTKMQKTSLEKNNSSFFHEFAWNESEIEFIMSRIARQYGEIHSFLPRRRYLVFTFLKHTHDYLFLNKYERIQRQLVWKQHSKLQGCVLDYYVLSKNQLLQSEMQTSRLFLLPNNEKITDLAIAQQWIIVAAQTYVLFIHSYRSMELFHHEQINNPTRIAHHHISSKVLFIADLKGVLYCFHLEHEKPILMAKYNVSFVRPHCISHLESGMAIAGIDHDGSVSKRRSIYLVRLQGLKQQKKNKPIPIQMRLQVVILPDAKGWPISNISPTKIHEIVACNCGPNFYLVSIKGFKLIEVKLASSINQIVEVPFLFNELNFIVLLNNTGEVIRVGMESYGEKLGTEINQVSSDFSKDCITFSSPISRFQLLVCSEGSIDKLSYLNNTRTTLLKEKMGTVVKLAWKNEGMAYLLDLEHSIELKYLQI